MNSTDGVVGRTCIAEGSLRLVMQPFTQRQCEPRLANSGFAGYEGHLPASLLRLPPARERKLEFLTRPIHSVDEAAERVPTNSARRAGARSQVLVPMARTSPRRVLRWLLLSHRRCRGGVNSAPTWSSDDRHDPEWDINTECAALGVDKEVARVDLPSGCECGFEHQKPSRRHGEGERPVQEH
jgi:hypothetical protein